MREFGAEQRGRDIWMIFAAPVVLPARGDAASVSRVILDLVNAARAARPALRRQVLRAR